MDNLRESAITITRHRSASPLADHDTRTQEKLNLQSLNDRLAGYIEKVRRLESENSKLQTVVSSYTESQSREIDSIKIMYDNELAESRRILDDLAKDRAKFEIDSGKHKCDAEDAFAKLSGKEREIRQLDNFIKDLENRNGQLYVRNETLEGETVRRQSEMKGLRFAISDLETQLAKARQQLEEETLLRVDLENRNTSLKEEVNFRRQVHYKEMEQIKTEKRSEIRDDSDRIQAEYDSQLMNGLNQVRSDTDIRMQQIKEEIEMNYEKQLEQANETMNKTDALLSKLKNDLLTARTRIQELNETVNGLQRQLGSREEQMGKLESKQTEMQQRLMDSEVSCNEQLRNAKDDYNTLLAEQQELLDVKVSLDQEINVYRKLMDCEEARLGINRQSSPEVNTSSFAQGVNDGDLSSNVRAQNRANKVRAISGDDDMQGSISSIETRSRKRRRLEEEHRTRLQSAHHIKCVISGPIEFVELDNDGGGFIALRNNSNNTITVGCWSVRRSCEKKGKVTEFVFPSKTKMQKGAIATIYSSVENQRANQVDVFSLTGKNWPVGDTTVTSVFDQNGKEMCQAECTKNNERTVITRSSMSRPQGRSSGFDAIQR